MLCSTLEAKKHCGRARLEALAVHNGRAGLVVLLLGDPHLLEGGQRGQNRAADPHRVLALRGGDDLDLHGRGRQRGELLLHAVGNAGEHGGAAGQHDVAVQVLHWGGQSEIRGRGRE